MERITMSLDSVLADLFDNFIAEHGYTNRSEAMRDLIRQQLEKEQLEKSGDGYCVVFRKRNTFIIQEYNTDAA